MSEHNNGGGSPPPPPNPHATMGEFGPEVTTQMWQMAVDDKAVTLEEANASLLEQGLSPLAVKPEPNTEAAWFPPAQKHEFDLTAIGNPFGADSEQVGQMRDFISEGMVAAEFPKEMAKSYVEMVKEQSEKLEGLSQAQKIEWAKKQRQGLESVYKEKTQEKMDKVHRFLSDLEKKSPGAGRFLINNGGAMSAINLSSLLYHIERLERVHGRKY